MSERTFEATVENGLNEAVRLGFIKGKLYTLNRFREWCNRETCAALAQLEEEKEATKERIQAYREGEQT